MSTNSTMAQDNPNTTSLCGSSKSSEAERVLDASQEKAVRSPNVEQALTSAEPTVTQCLQLEPHKTQWAFAGSRQESPPPEIVVLPVQPRTPMEQRTSIYPQYKTRKTADVEQVPAPSKPNTTEASSSQQILKSEDGTIVDIFLITTKLTDIQWIASKALQERFLHFYQPDLYAEQGATTPHPGLIQICNTVACTLTNYQQIILACAPSSSEYAGSQAEWTDPEMDKMSLNYKAVTGREEELFELSRLLLSTLNDAEAIFKAWARRQNFTLTVFETWMRLVQFETYRVEIHSKPDWTEYLRKHVYVFCLAVLTDANFPIHRPLTHLWLVRYGSMHANLAHIALKQYSEKELTAENTWTMLEPLAILYVKFQVHDHIDKRMHPLFRHSMNNPNEHVARVKRAFYTSVQKLSDYSHLLDEVDRRRLVAFKQFASELKFKDERAALHKGGVENTMAQLENLSQ